MPSSAGATVGPAAKLILRVAANTSALFLAVSKSVWESAIRGRRVAATWGTASHNAKGGVRDTWEQVVSRSRRAIRRNEAPWKVAERRRILSIAHIVVRRAWNRVPCGAYCTKRPQQSIVGARWYERAVHMSEPSPGQVGSRENAMTSLVQGRNWLSGPTRRSAGLRRCRPQEIKVLGRRCHIHPLVAFSSKCDSREDKPAESQARGHCSTKPELPPSHPN